jgi:hypothetical protein
VASLSVRQSSVRRPWRVRSETAVTVACAYAGAKRSA